MKEKALFFIVFVYFAHFLLCNSLTHITSAQNEKLREICSNRPNYRKSIYKIYHGKEATPGQFPWAVDIDKFEEYSRNYEHHCGGALITPKHVLTAAHCVNEHTCNGEFSPDLFIVRLEKLKEGKGYPIRISALVGHPRWGSGIGVGKCFAGGDIAILELNSPVPAALINNGSVGFVCLPAKDLPFGLKAMIAHGWGMTLDIATKNKLLWTKLAPMNHDECARRKETDVPSDTLCTYETNSNVCGGDSGGPLLLKNKQDRYSVAGIVSFGTQCNKMEENAKHDDVENVGGFFTDVRKHLDWICEQTGACYTLYNE